MKKRLLVVAIPTRPSSSSLDPLLSAAVPPSPPNRGGRERGGPRQGRPRGHRRRRPGTPRSRSCSPGRSPTRCDNIGGACGDGSAAAGAYRPGHHGLGQGASQGPEICGRSFLGYEILLSRCLLMAVVLSIPLCTFCIRPEMLG